MRRHPKKTAKKLRRTTEERARGRLATQECRDRERRHLALHVVAIDSVTLDTLVDQHYLTDAQVLDKRLVNKALSAFLWDQTRQKFS